MVAGLGRATLNQPALNELNYFPSRSGPSLGVGTCRHHKQAVCIAFRIWPNQSFSMPQPKKPITVRLNSDLLDEVRESAARENRSLTNFIETALRDCVRSMPDGARESVSRIRSQVNRTNKNT
jgi:hypothetical protein